MSSTCSNATRVESSPLNTCPASISTARCRAASSPLFRKLFSDKFVATSPSSQPLKIRPKTKKSRTLRIAMSWTSLSKNLSFDAGPAGTTLCSAVSDLTISYCRLVYRPCQYRDLSYIRQSWFFSMILHINHVQPERAALASSVVSTLVSLAGDAQIPSRILDNLNVHLEWVQYKTNFREAVTLRRVNRGDEVLPWMEVGIDLRQAHPETLKEEFVNALRDLNDPACAARQRAYLEPFTPMRSCMIWRFNNLFWQHLPLWEAASGKGFEKA